MAGMLDKWLTQNPDQDLGGSIAASIARAKKQKAQQGNNGPVTAPISPETPDTSPSYK